MASTASSLASSSACASSIPVFFSAKGNEVQAFDIDEGVELADYVHSEKVEHVRCYWDDSYILVSGERIVSAFAVKTTYEVWT